MPPPPSDQNHTENTTADQLRSLLARWQQSLELHAKYLALDDQRYWHVQPWPQHERPAKWIVDLARKRVAVLSRIVAARTLEGDRAFIEALEAMAFLANLVGLTTVERFIPLASSEAERREILAARDPTATVGKQPPSLVETPTADPTQEMPRLPASRVHRLLLQQRAGVPMNLVDRSNVVAHRAPRRDGERPAARTSPACVPAVSFERLELLVVDDAARLLGWGRKWHELPDLIARLAERPTVDEIRRILRQHRAQIATLRGGPID